MVLALCIGLLGCRAPGPEVSSAVEIGTLEQSEMIEGRDGGGSAVAWGRSVWVYGDTVLTVADEQGRNWHHNSYSMTEDLDASDGITGFVEPLDSAGAPQHFIPRARASRRSTTRIGATIASSNLAGRAMPYGQASRSSTRPAIVRWCSMG